MDTLNEATKPDIIADVDAPAVVISENNAEVDLIIKEFEDELQAKVFTVILLIIYMLCVVCSVVCFRRNPDIFSPSLGCMCRNKMPKCDYPNAYHSWRTFS